ncbi:uroporphyrinogen-III synthase [Anaerobacillus alkalilacustris]|uniref:Uroporphyrinogen-III synthase n=1 Tax=Anaerobacillus alkalilacustris TaxID=393763 RepID=A0A1S2LW81_9BACI|nr:uroporphyrinogen-III synthase [Anaerobacillus alkalilacustris]OIJ16802.1 uroporphyrinogen-III synthase [Anaerobacillus alkalilacustris]
MSLTGKKVVIAGSRKLEEMSLLVEKQGGVPLIRSLQGTVFLAEKQVEPTLQKLVQEGCDVIIFTTGIGIETLIDISDKIGIKEQFLNLVKTVDVASRGYKSFAALKKLGVHLVAVDEDGTTDGLIRALQNYNFSGKKVAVQLHGDLAPRLIQFLEDHGATVQQILPYQHTLPKQETVELLCKELQDQEVDAVCFTTAIQVRSLFQYAREYNLNDLVVHAFQNHVLAVAVGKITAEALREEGINNYLSPDRERMGAMIMELAQFYKNKLI